MSVRKHKRQNNLRRETKNRGMRRYEADKKVRSTLYLDSGAEGKRVFSRKHSRVKVLAISFKEFLDLLEAAFVKPTDITFERYRLLSRKQKDRESYEQFWGSLSNLARSCEIGINAEQEWIRYVIIFNMRNCDLQGRLF